MEPVINKEEPQKSNPHFLFMGIGSLIYAFFYTLFLYRNGSGITYPFFVGGTCLYFFLYLKRSGITAKKDMIFYVVCLMLLGLSTCMTDSAPLLFLNKLGIFLLFFCMLLHSVYEDKNWDLSKYLGSIFHFLCTSLALLLRPFTDFISYRKARKGAPAKSNGKLSFIFFGFLISLPLAVVILILLASADAVFAELIGRMAFGWLEYLLDDTEIGGIVWFFFFAFFASYCLLLRLGIKDIKEETENRRTKEPVTAITFTSVISFVYFIFCGIQIVYLFAGKGSLPFGYTYAQYARQGFFQLVFVCLINLSLALLCIKYFRPHPVLKGLLTFISVCTFIMIASSVYRMLLYISVYQLTFLRVFVLWALLVILFLMAGAAVMIYRESFPYFRYALAVVTVLYLVFSFSHPDYLIARYNLSHLPSSDHAPQMDYGEEGETVFDPYYLAELSADAAPALYPMAEKMELTNSYWYQSYTKAVHDSSWEQDSFRKWNLSRWTAKQYDKQAQAAL